MIYLSFKDFKILWIGTECNHIAFNRISKSGRSGDEAELLMTDGVLHGTEFNQITFNGISRDGR